MSRTKDNCSNAYLQSPQIKGDFIYFHTDDDIWSVSRLGGSARRLTNSHGLSRNPLISPDGSLVAYLTNDQGQFDISIIPSTGGIPSRLTYKGVRSLGPWLDNKTIVFSSCFEAFSQRVTYLYKLNIESREISPLNLGQATTLVQEKGIRILGKNLGDPARWKRYRGGTAGTLWINLKKDANFKPFLPKLQSNLANPQVYEERVYFISDHEGTGNVYSALSSGRSLRRETHQELYYVRKFHINEGTLVFQAGGDIYTKEISEPKAKGVLIDIHVPSSFNQSTKRLEDAEDFLQEASPSSNGHQLAFITRGQLFTRRPWTEAPIRLGHDHHRYKLPTFVQKDKTQHILSVELNEEKEEGLVLFTPNEENPLETKVKKLALKNDWGKIEEIKTNPKKPVVALSNNRNELFIVTIPAGKVTMIAKNNFRYYEDFNWSPCGRYLAFMEPESRTSAHLNLYDYTKKESRQLLRSVLMDLCPTFDPSGDYLFFIGVRDFHPIYNETHFDLGFPFAMGLYALVLEKDCPSPLELYKDFEDDEDEEEENEKKKEDQKKESKSTKTKEAEEETKIDWDGLEDRVIALPLRLGGYLKIACAEDKLYILQHQISDSDGSPLGGRMPSPKPSLYTFCLKERKKEVFQKDVFDFSLTTDTSKVLIHSDSGLRLVSSEAKAPEGEGQNKKDGFINLDNIKLTLEPKKEWLQMYREAWVLQREHFWASDMNKIDWQKVYHNYLPLLNKVHTRSEFSDLMWEMQGELGTSHCYEFGGDYFRTPFSNTNGDLGASFKWNKADKSFTIVNLASGDSWIKSASSPLKAPGNSLKEGDKILGAAGRGFQSATDLDEVLEGMNNQKISLTVKRKGQSKVEVLAVTPLRHSNLTRYRDWVNHNKELVHKLSKGKVGYLHVPDMGIHGYSEFYRNFLSECTKEGLIVDVRYNGGGHVSQHLLKILAQKTVGFDKTRYMDIEPYPAYAINGPIVALTNEHAGSDGDIFSHSFKLMNIGPLIGKRTWGGVVGIWPRHPLNDGTITSQPEFSFWFKDVGYNVENYGTDPDIEVENTPKDWAQGRDAQLERAVKEALKLRVKNPPLKVNLNQGRPNLKAPKLPKL